MCCCVFFFKQKTAYDRRISDWSSDVCSSDLQANLRRDALEAIKGVKWYPAWGEARIAGMIEGRPDWTISRQRTWGVPIALFVHRESGEPHPRSTEIMR